MIFWDSKHCTRANKTLFETDQRLTKNPELNKMQLAQVVSVPVSAACSRRASRKQVVQQGTNSDHSAPFAKLVILWIIAV